MKYFAVDTQIVTRMSDLGRQMESSNSRSSIQIFHVQGRIDFQLQLTWRFEKVEMSAILIESNRRGIGTKNIDLKAADILEGCERSLNKVCVHDV